jgi:hypothetical protein
MPASSFYHGRQVGRRRSKEGLWRLSSAAHVGCEKRYRIVRGYPRRNLPRHAGTVSPRLLSCRHQAEPGRRAGVPAPARLGADTPHANLLSAADASSIPDETWRSALDPHRMVYVDVPHGAVVAAFEDPDLVVDRMYVVGARDQMTRQLPEPIQTSSGQSASSGPTTRESRQ